VLAGIVDFQFLAGYIRTVLVVVLLPVWIVWAWTSIKLVDASVSWLLIRHAVMVLPDLAFFRFLSEPSFCLAVLLYVFIWDDVRCNVPTQLSFCVLSDEEVCTRAT
jgi:hypothetical protein